MSDGDIAVSGVLRERKIEVVAFSVLLPVYIGDREETFRRALRSVGADQTLRPSQIVVVCDGPVEARIASLLQRVEAGGATDLTGGAQVTVVRVPVNGGLAHALTAGLQCCKSDLVARADADDISVPHRFATQVPVMLQQHLDLLGSAIVEFSDDEHHTGLVRRMPESLDEIRKVITYRDPFNHPTVVFRRSAVDQVGGYEHVNHMEDYWLFARMVQSGKRCANIDAPLVLYRIGEGAYSRRGGWTMLRSELTLQRRLRAAGITTTGQWLRNVVVRGLYRLIPSGVRRFVYRAVGVRRWFS